MIKRIVSATMVAVFLALPLGTVALNPPQWERLKASGGLEHYLQNELIYAQTLQGLAANILLLIGQNERDGVFYTEDGLLIDYRPTHDEQLREENAAAIVAFSQHYSVPTMAVVVPTAVAIKQKQVSDYATLFNQKAVLGHLSEQMEGYVTFVDVYASLLANYDISGEYLYYRTMEGLTSLGGYRVYSSLAERMRLTPYDLRDFEREYVYHDLRGELTEIWPSMAVQSDILTVYHTVDKTHSISMLVQDTDGTVSHYDTFYPTPPQENPMGVYLGGHTSYTEIEQLEGLGRGRLLIFGDETANSVLPFLALHYEHVTYINLAEVQNSRLHELAVDSYDQVVFCYGVESFCDSDEIQEVNRILR